MTDLFTTWSKSAEINPWFFPDSISGVLGLAQSGQQNVKKRDKMKHLSIYLILTLLSGLFFCCSHANTGDEGDLKAGISQIDITPPIGYPVHKKPSNGILDLNQNDATEAGTIHFLNGTGQGTAYVNTSDCVIFQGGTSKLSIC